MSQSFSLSVPADSRYRILAPELAVKYVEGLGGTPAEAESLAAALVESMNKLAPPDTHVDIELVFHAATSGIEITLRSAGKSDVVTHRWPASRH